MTEIIFRSNKFRLVNEFIVLYYPDSSFPDFAFVCAVLIEGEWRKVGERICSGLALCDLKKNGAPTSINPLPSYHADEESPYNYVSRIFPT